MRLVVLASVNSNTLIDKETPVKARSRLPIVARLTTARRKIIIEDYGSGLSTRAVAIKNNVSKTTVLKVLEEAEVPRRPRGGSRSKH